MLMTLFRKEILGRQAILGFCKVGEKGRDCLLRRAMIGCEAHAHQGLDWWHRAAVTHTAGTRWLAGHGLIDSMLLGERWRPAGGKAIKAGEVPSAQALHQISLSSLDHQWDCVPLCGTWNCPPCCLPCCCVHRLPASWGPDQPTHPTCLVSIAVCDH